MNNHWDEEDFEVDEDDFDDDDFKIRFVSRQEVVDSLLDSILERGYIDVEMENLLRDITDASS